MNDIIDYVSSFGNVSGIIYARQRDVTENLCEKLIASGIKAGVYHAGKKTSEKQKVLKDWLDDNIWIICCTVAFGMGIDKPDVRFVVHFNLPTSLENFYQESGRAGRDGLPSYSRLYFSLSDFLILQEMSRGKEHMPSTYLDKCSRGIEGLYEFCNQPVCRRKQLVKYFGEDLSQVCNSCDICSPVQDTICPAFQLNSQSKRNLSKQVDESSTDTGSVTLLASNFCKASVLLAEERRAKPKYIVEDNATQTQVSREADWVHKDELKTNVSLEFRKRKELDDMKDKQPTERRQNQKLASKIQSTNEKTLLHWFSEAV